MIRHLKRKMKAYRIMWWMSFALSLVGVAMTAATVYFEVQKGIASNMLYPSFAIVVVGIIFILVTADKEMEAELAIMEREEQIAAWYEKYE